MPPIPDDAAAADPADPDEFRAMGHRVIDLLADYLAGIEARPLFPGSDPEALERLFDEPIPREGTSAEAVIRDVETRLFPHLMGVNHPGYFGLITPTPLPIGVLGDLIASALNQNVGAWTIGPGAVALERRTVRWLDDLVGYGPGAGGNLTSGGTTANFIGLKLARDFASGDRAQHTGLRESWGVYVSEERHVSVDKAVDAVGAGREAMRILPTDETFRVRIDAVERAIADDRARGVRPMCVVALAGTTNTGAVDDLAALRRIADDAGAWLHADAAYGGGVLCSDTLRGQLDGLPLADSVTLDPHKWLFAPLDAGAILVRDEGRLTSSFGLRPSYLVDEMDDEGERYAYYVHGFEQSRRFRALKVWMAFHRHGSRAIGRWVEANCALARRLHERASASGDFESAVAPPMSAVCMRYCGPGLEGGADERRVARLHHVVARRIEAAGRFWISTTVLKGRSWFRINPVNFRTREAHVDALLADLRRDCAEVALQLSTSDE